MNTFSMIAPTISGDAAENGNEILFLTVKFVPIFYVNFFVVILL